jgi:hypothetical protein
MVRSTGHAKLKRRSIGADVGFLALPVLLAVLMALAFTQPGASNLISEAAQAEFANAYLAKIAPTQIAPPKEIRTVRAN